MRFVRFKELKPVYGIPWTRAHIDQLIAAGKFPPKVALGENTKAWSSLQIEEWMRERAEEGTEAA